MHPVLQAGHLWAALSDTAFAQSSSAVNTKSTMVEDGGKRARMVRGLQHAFDKRKQTIATLDLQVWLELLFLQRFTILSRRLVRFFIIYHSTT